jgi:Tfp pilus assembly PilM family ATPase
VVKEGLIRDASGLASAVGDLLRTQKGSRGRIITALDGLRVTARVLKLPRMGKSMYEEAIRREAKRVMPLPEEELCLSWQIIESGEKEQRFFVVGVARNLLQTQIEALKQLRITPHLMEPKAVALARVVNREEALILDIEPEGFEIILATEGIPLLTHRGLWRRGATTPEEKVQHLMHELSRTLKFYSTTYPDKHLDPQTPAFLTGELALNPAISELCHRQTNYAIEPLEPPLDCPPDLPIPQYAVNMGLALKQMAPARGLGKGRFPLAELNVNLTDSSRDHFRPLKQTFAIVGIVGAIALLVPLNQANSRAIAETDRLRAQVASVTQELNMRKIELKKAAALSKALAETTAKAESLEQANRVISDRRISFAQSLRVVMETLGRGGKLTSINIAPGRMTLKGEADSISSVTSYAGSLLKTGYFSRVDLDFLTKSSKEGHEVTFTIVVEL